MTLYDREYLTIKPKKTHPTNPMDGEENISAPYFSFAHASPIYKKERKITYWLPLSNGELSG